MQGKAALVLTVDGAGAADMAALASLREGLAAHNGDHVHPTVEVTTASTSPPHLDAPEETATTPIAGRRVAGTDGSTFPHEELTSSRARIVASGPAASS